MPSLAEASRPLPAEAGTPTSPVAFLRIGWWALTVAAALLGWPAGTLAAPFDSPPNPLCDEHLVIIRPADFRNDNGQAVARKATADTVFGTTVPVTAAVVAAGQVRFPGRYALWIRSGQAPGVRPLLQAQLRQGDRDLLTGTFHAGEGAPGRGGPAGAKAFADEALKYAPTGAASTDINVAAQLRSDLLAPEDKGGDAALAAAGDAIVEEVRREAGRGWVNVMRIDPKTADGYCWWRVGEADLAAGTCQLQAAPTTALKRDAQPLVDAAFLTTYLALPYPCARDLSAPRGSYLRFRLDHVPTGGVTITAGINTHAYPYWHTPAVYLNPSGLSVSGVTQVVEPHTRPGYTRWFCLQDIPRAPGVASGPVQLGISLGGGRDRAGATQFAMYPYLDWVVREFAWDEPDGTQLNLVMDFEAGREYLKTFRDCAREHYEMALASAEERLFPLTRGGLLLGPGNGGATGATLGYLWQTFRVLGFNVVGNTGDALGARRRYGWSAFAGVPRMPWHIPFEDEPAALAAYEKDYAFFANPKEQANYRGITVWQMVDEPGEAYGSQYTAPLWRYETPEKGEPRWVDYPGSSGLATRRTDYHDCVLEGRLARLGGAVTIMVAMDDAVKPTRYGYWRVGTVLPDGAEENFMAGRVGIGVPSRTASKIPAAVVGPGLTPFKIVCEQDRIGLFINGVMVHQFTGMPERGGFGFSEDSKALAALRFRRLGKADHIIPKEAGGDGGLTNDEELPELAPDETETPTTAADDWAKPKPLKEFIEQDWVVTGGFPETHRGFRQWAAAQGVQPALFGKPDWDQVTMLTIPNLVQDEADRRLYYWSRRYSSYITPKTFSLAAEAIRRQSPNKSVQSYVGLSGGYPNAFGYIISDMFQLAAYDNGLMPGISDWHTGGTEGGQVNAFSAAFFVAGARRYDGRPPASVSMMHIVHPSLLRAYASLATDVKYLSYYTFGPLCLGVGYDAWSDIPECYDACSLTDNRAAQADDLLAPARLRPSRVAMLYAMSSWFWGQDLLTDKRAAFLALAHEYYQPELVTEDQIVAGALAHYDALYVFDPVVCAAAQDRIGAWTKAGGLLWASTNALSRNEYNEPADLLATLCGLHRDSTGKPRTTARVSPVAGEVEFTPHAVDAAGIPARLQADQARVRARYDDGTPAWLEWGVDRGRVVYLGHRAGLTYRAQQIRTNGPVWADTGRAVLTVPVSEAKVPRELTVSEPLILASPLSTEAGTVIVLYNLQPRPRRQLTISLREPQPPHSVEAFSGLTLGPLPFTYEAGCVKMKLDELAVSQMIVVRRQPAPLDTRLAELRAQATQLLAAAGQPYDLAAGAWYAGFRPDWQLADRVVPLLKHSQWEVRRTAAEALGRLRHAPAAEPLLAAVAAETDAHARGDELVALGQLHEPRVLPPCQAGMAHRDVFVRRQALRAIATFVPLPDDLRPAAVELAQQGLADPDPRVRREAIHLLAAVAPKQAVDAALAAFAAADATTQGAWVQAVATHDAAFADFVTRGAPEPLLVAVAGVRADPRLAAALRERLAGMTAASALAWAAALVTQQDQALVRQVLADAKLSPLIGGRWPHVLTCVFPVRLGNDLAAWQEWLKPH